MFRKSLIGAAAVMVCGLMLGCGDEGSDGKSGGEVSESRRNEIAAELRKEGVFGNAFVLALAAATGTPKEVSALIDKDADVSATTAALLAAAKWNENPAITTALLNAGADINAKDKKEYGKTALLLAVENNKNLEVITTLIKAGADVNARGGELGDNEFDMTPLHLAIENNQNTAVITALIKAGADMNAQTSIRGRYGFSSGDTPLRFAVKKQNLEIITALVKAGADVVTGSPLRDANPEIINALIKAGADQTFMCANNLTLIGLELAALSTQGMPGKTITVPEMFGGDLPEHVFICPISKKKYNIVSELPSNLSFDRSYNIIIASDSDVNAHGIGKNPCRLFGNLHVNSNGKTIVGADKKAVIVSSVDE